jgi:DNA-directed RNA polymerase delta subunit
MQTVQLSFKPKAVSKKLLNALNPRTREVITKRYGLADSERKTLESIGKEYGITRERVRQIENFALGTIRKSSDFKEHQHVFEELATIVKNMGSLVPEDILMDAFSNDKVVHNHMNFFMTVSDKFKKDKEDDNFTHRWNVDQEVAKHVHNALTSLHSSVEKDDLLKEEDMIARFVSNLIELSDEYKNNKDVIDRYLKLSKIISKNPLNEWGHVTSSSVKARGIKDFAYLILRQNNAPMHFRDIANNINKTFNKNAHVATCHNELIKDKRFILVGRGMYGLKVWGQAGGTVKDLIAQVLEESGEKMNKEDIVRKVLELRDVKENTVLVNLNNPKLFKKFADGKYNIV